MSVLDNLLVTLVSNESVQRRVQICPCRVVQQRRIVMQTSQNRMDGAQRSLLRTLGGDDWYWRVANGQRSKENESPKPEGSNPSRCKWQLFGRPSSIAQIGPSIRRFSDIPHMELFTGSAIRFRQLDGDAILGKKP